MTQQIVQNTPGCGGCNACLQESDPFAGTMLSPRWSTVSDPARVTVTAGDLRIAPASAGRAYGVYDRDLASEGWEGCKVLVDVARESFDNAGALAMILLAWQDPNNYLDATFIVNSAGQAFLTAHQVTGGTATLIGGARAVTLYSPTERVRLEVCLFPAPAGSELQYVMRIVATPFVQGTPFELMCAVRDAPTTLRTGLEARNRAFRFDNWELHKVDEECPCLGAVTACCHGYALPHLLYLTITVLDAGDPPCACANVQDLPIPSLTGVGYGENHEGYNYRVVGETKPRPDGGLDLFPLFCRIFAVIVECPTFAPARLRLTTTAPGDYNSFWYDFPLFGGPDAFIVSCNPFYVVFHSDDPIPSEFFGYHITDLICYGSPIFGPPVLRRPKLLIEIHE
jgi:hypothetical protein